MYPPETIGAGSLSRPTTATWASESDGMMTGTEGQATYIIEAGENTTVTCKWDNPYVGGNSYGCTTSDSSKYTAGHDESSGGNNATVVMHVKTK